MNGVVVDDLRPVAGGTENDSLGDWLKNKRLARNMTLEAAQARTKIGKQLLERLERNDLETWRSERFYKEHFLRVYAGEVGLNPREAVERFRREFPIVEAAPPPVEPTTPVRPLWLVVSACFAAACILALVVMYRPSALEAEDRIVQNATPSSAQQIDVKPPAVADVPPTAVAVAPPLPAAPAPQLAQPAPAPPAPLALVADPVPPAREDFEGELMITSTPPGAHVTVNGVARGETPARVRFLPPGTYTIRIIETGYRIAERRAMLSPERARARVSVTLEPRATHAGGAF